MVLAHYFSWDGSQGIGWGSSLWRAGLEDLLPGSFTWVSAESFRSLPCAAHNMASISPSDPRWRLQALINCPQKWHSFNSTAGEVVCWAHRPTLVKCGNVAVWIPGVNAHWEWYWKMGTTAPFFCYLFVHSSICKHSLDPFYMPETVLDLGDTIVTKIHIVSMLMQTKRYHIFTMIKIMLRKTTDYLWGSHSIL